MPDESIKPPDRAQRLLSAIFATSDAEIDCERFASVLSGYVDLEIAGSDADRLEPGFLLHARLCPECAEVYHALRRVSVLEAEGLLPRADELWAELAALAVRRPGEPAARAVPASALATTVDAPVPSSGGGTRGGTSRESRRADESDAPRRWLPRWTGRPALSLAGAGVAVALVLVGLTVRDRLPGSAAPTENVTREAELADGGMVRVAFSPESDKFVITAERAVKPLRKLKCWLVRLDGSRHEPKLDWEKDDASWIGWADRPMRDFVMMSIVSMPDEDEVARISLK